MAKLLAIGEMGALALHVLTDLATLRAEDPEGRRNVRDIAEKLGASVHTLQKVARRLVVLGWVEGARGVGGGLRLLADPERLTLLNVVEGLDGPVCAHGCLFDKRVCPAGARCAFAGLTESLERQVLDYFRGTTLADLRDGVENLPDAKGDGHGPGRTENRRNRRG